MRQRKREREKEREKEREGERDKEKVTHCVGRRSPMCGNSLFIH